jgi:serine/threonine protein kinase/DNA-binding winged helix-turn-helix (wHTH) protein/Tol biopolymer transport system component
MGDTPVKRISFGEFELDVRAGELRKGGLRIRLQEQPFQILLMLLEHPGEVVTREEIRKRLWPNDTIVEFDHSIGTAIKKLRQALRDEAESPRYVETLPRRGFRFIFPLDASIDAPEESSVEPPPLIDADKPAGEEKQVVPDAAPAQPANGAPPNPADFTHSDLIGRTVSHYRIVEKVGGGGMGVVYKAEDTKLGRKVALKFLPTGLARNPRALARFEREARAASAPNHPHICTIYEIEEVDGHPFLAMELMEGQTLKDLLVRPKLASARPTQGSALQIDTLLDLALDIAEALEAAHAEGIVHRDIKPANIFVTKRGEAKVLDFGLAKWTASAGDEEQRPRVEAGEASTLSILDPQLTIPGAAMGTAAYMSPEQARGEEVDARTDLFSFGAVLYEMATGQQAFGGATLSELREAILTREVSPPQRLNPTLDTRLQAIIEKALEKDRDVRYQHASEMRADLKRLRRDTESGRITGRLKAAGEESAVPTARFRRVRLLWGIGAVAVVLLLAGLFFYRTQQTRVAAPAEWVQLTNFTDSATSPALSPDGRMLAFIRGPETFFGPGEIYVKMLPGGEPVQLTQDGLAKMSPVFSPDGSRIAYTVAPPFDTWEVSVLGGEPRRLLANASGLTWIDGQHLLFSEIKSGLHMALVTAAESRTEQRDVYVPPPERGMAHRSYLSPDRQWVLLSEMDNGGWLPCRLVPFDGSSSGKQVGPPGASCTSAAWSPYGKWMYFSSNAGGRFHIWRQRYPDGEPEQVTFGPTEEEGIAIGPEGRSLLTSVGMEESAVWIRDSNGERQISSEGFAEAPSLSPDGTKAYYLVRPQGTTGPFTNGGLVRSAGPFTSGALWAVELKGGRSEQPLPGFAVTKYDISLDGRRIVFAAQDPHGKSHLWIASTDRRFPPRQIPSSTSDDSPIFGPAGDIFFRAVEGGSNFIYRVKEDGTGRQKVLPNPILDFFSVAPDGEWLIAGAQVSHEEITAALSAYPVHGGTPVRICSGDCDARWDRAGKFFYVGLIEMGNRGGRARTIVLPAPHGGDLPKIPLSGINSPEDAKGLSGVKVIDEVVSPGATTSVYISTRNSVHRNLYSIPLP